MRPSPDERAWWGSPEGQALERELLQLMDEDEAMAVVVLIQKSFTPRAMLEVGHSPREADDLPANDRFSGDGGN